jgi:sulfate adenylyltransferase subunit 1 (EFTu-like GTPase family)
LNLQTAQWISQTAESTHADVSANDIVEATIEFASALPIANFTVSNARGTIVLVDPGTHTTAAAAMVRNVSQQ